jgi:hypothetical protein
MSKSTVTRAPAPSKLTEHDLGRLNATIARLDDAVGYMADVHRPVPFGYDSKSAVLYALAELRTARRFVEEVLKGAAE